MRRRLPLLALTRLVTVLAVVGLPSSIASRIEAWKQRPRVVTGAVVFDWAVPNMTVISALPVLLEPGTPAAVALIAASPRAVNRWRLQIVSREKTLLYDELLDTPTERLKARGPDGADRLFLDRASLLALRRRSG
ncbi:MAG TPA: hypothetical protein VFO31_26660 [Vicinamibacterales bacterium]|nr:hypothetical protein [Vicinamibacterales bacterium]